MVKDIISVDLDTTMLDRRHKNRFGRRQNRQDRWRERDRAKEKETDKGRERERERYKGKHVRLIFSVFTHLFLTLCHLASDN